MKKTPYLKKDMTIFMLFYKKICRNSSETGFSLIRKTGDAHDFHQIMRSASPYGPNL